MHYFLLIISFIVLVYGIMNFILPRKSKQLDRQLVRALPFWVWGAISLLIAVLFWYSTTAVFYPLVVQILAILSALKGFVLIVFSKTKFEDMMEWWFNLSDIKIRLIGFLYIVFAFFLFSIIVVY